MRITEEEWNVIVGIVDANVKPETSKPYYSYENFKKAIKKYPEFSKGNRVPARREVAAFLAHLFQETRFSYNHEIRCYGGPTPCDDYGNAQWGVRYNLLAVPGCTRAEWECRYFGRGPMQLTWYLNYLDTSIAIFGDDRLAKEPWQVTDDPVVGWMTAIHFWMTNTGRESMTAHQAIRKGDFGKTISVVNGNQECGRSWDARAQTRVDKYVEYCRVLGVPPGKMLRC
jgi:hypothetical protein